MLRFSIEERSDWQQQAEDYGFHFHTMYGEPYWDESAYYRFTLSQIEKDIEDPTEEIHQMCLHVVDKVISNEALLTRFGIPEYYWDYILLSWQRQDPSLYSRLDLAYSGTSPAKLLENNADTPTSVYETGFWQWLWLEQQVDNRKLPQSADQFNSLQEKLIERFYHLHKQHPHWHLHFACSQGSVEDRGTVQYLQDCAHQAGLPTGFTYVENIGLAESGEYTNLENQPLHWLFKLYPWEFMFQEEFGQSLIEDRCRFIEPPWKSILSNKALLPLLWKEFKGHPNLLPAFFEEDLTQANETTLVKKPLFSREGANISIIQNEKAMMNTEGPYGSEGFIYQAYTPLPKFGDQYALIGSWLVNGKAAGMSIREDRQLITQDMSRYLPHIIVE